MENAFFNKLHVTAIALMLQALRAIEFYIINILYLKYFIYLLVNIFNGKKWYYDMINQVL